MKTIGSPGTKPTVSKGSGLASSSDSSSSKRPPSVDALHVGDEVIEPGSLWRFERTQLLDAASRLDTAAFRHYLEQTTARLVRDTTTEYLLYQKAKERITPQMEKGITSFVDADIRKIVTEQFGGIQRRYERDLRGKGLTLDETREKMRRDVVITSFLDAEIKPKIVEPSRGDLLEAYEAYVREHKRPARRRMSLIDVRTANRLASDAVDPTPEQLAAARRAARTLIEKAQRELRDGASFGEVAHRYSDGLHAANGGSWGWVRRGTVRKRFEPAVEALYTLDPGAISDVIETDRGFFIVRCDEKDAGGIPDFVTLQPELNKRFRRNMFNHLVSELVDELQEKSRITPEDLDRFWRAALREGERIVEAAKNGPPAP